MKNKEQARTTAGVWMTPSGYNAGAQATFSVPDSIVINEIMYHPISGNDEFVNSRQRYMAMCRG